MSSTVIEKLKQNDDENEKMPESELKDVKIEVSENVKEEENKKKEEIAASDSNGQSQTSIPNQPSKQQEKNVSNSEGIHPPNYIAGGFEIIGIKERHGQLRKAVPIMPLPFAIVCCIVNLCLPGIGTIVASISLFCCAETEYKELSKSQAFLLNVITGLLQLITAIILVGWIWSIIWGVTFLTLSTNKRTTTNKEANTKVDV